MEEAERGEQGKVKAIWHSVFSTPSLNMDVSYLWSGPIVTDVFQTYNMPHSR